MGSRQWSNVTKIIVIAILAVVALALLVTFRVMIAPTVVAFFLAFILNYPTNWIQRSTAWARGAAILVVYVVLVGLVALASVLIIPRSVEVVAGLRTSLEHLIANLQSLPAGPLFVLGPLRLSPNTLLQQAGDALNNVLALATRNPLSLARGVTNSIITTIYVLVLTFWILKDSYRLQRVILEALPADYQNDATNLGREISDIWHAFLRGQLLLALAVGVITWLPLVIVGMPNAGGLAVLAGIMEFLPSIGPGISGAIGTIFAFFFGSTWMPVGNLTFAIIVLVIYLVIAQIENIYLMPRLVGGQVRLHPAVAFVAIVSGTIVFGLLGVLLAAPIVASARTLLVYIGRKLLDLEPFEEITPAQSGVRIPGLIAGHKIEGVIFDLDGALVEVDWSAQAWAGAHFTWLDRVAAPGVRGRLVRRAMLSWEGFINFLITQGRRFHAEPDLDERFPVLDKVRGLAAPTQAIPIAGAADLLHTLYRHYRLAIVSTRSRADVCAILERASLPAECIAVIVCRDDAPNLLPHSEPLVLATNRLGLESNQMLVVSDTDSTLRAARAAQMATAGVLSGLAEETDMSEADLCVVSVTALNEWL